MPTPCCAAGISRRAGARGPLARRTAAGGEQRDGTLWATDLAASSRVAEVNRTGADASAAKADRGTKQDQHRAEAWAAGVVGPAARSVRPARRVRTRPGARAWPRWFFLPRTVGPAFRRAAGGGALCAGRCWRRNRIILINTILALVFCDSTYAAKSCSAQGPGREAGPIPGKLAQETGLRQTRTLGVALQDHLPSLKRHLA